MPSIQAIINYQNKKILNKNQKPNFKSCNFRTEKNCPLNSKSCTNFIVYKAFLKSNQNQNIKTYYGSCKTSFKTHFNNHSNSFCDNWKKNVKELSKAVWTINDDGETPQITCNRQQLF